MGRHREKNKRHKRDKKRLKKQKRKGSSSSEEEWVEKKVYSSSSLSSNSDSTSSLEEKRIVVRKRRKQKRKGPSDSSSDEGGYGKHAKTSSSSEDCKAKKNIRSPSISSDDNVYATIVDQKKSDQGDNRKREEWMNLPTSFITSSNSEKKRKRDEEKKQERERQKYNPRDCTRELNPYWKDGGDGLPKFKKPENSDEENDKNHRSYRQVSKHGDRTSNWKKKKETMDGKNEYVADMVHKCQSQSQELKKEETASSTLHEEGNTDKILSEKELNLMAAKLVKAEIMGNTKLVNELKEKLETARKARKNLPGSDKLNEDEVLLTHTDSQGRTQPVRLQSEYGKMFKQNKKKNIETHKDGQRVRYFADDDKYSLKQMFENEKYNSVEDQNREFVKMTSKVRKNEDLDDIFSDNIRKKESDSRIDSRNRDKAINEFQTISKSLDNCEKCIQSESMPKHLMVSMGDTVYLALAPHEPLTKGHCLIVPIRHVPCATQLDENEWSDLIDMRRSLVKLFLSKNEDVIFFESATTLHRFPHMYIECIPLRKEVGDMAPIYFKKAIDECETEWAQNKKVIPLKGRDVRKAIPKGLPYFSVSFGMEEGFAHVIEDTQLFPTNFAQEIIGGMLDLHHSKWRKPKRQTFDEQSKRVVDFSKEWKEFDCTV